MRNVMKRFGLAVAVLGLVVGGVGRVEAGMVTRTETALGFSNNYNSAGYSVNLSFTNLPTPSIGDGSLTITAFGDFDASSEFTIADAEGVINFGRFLNNNPGDDLFDNASFGDIGNQYARPLTATAPISAMAMQALLADGQVDFVLSFSSAVNNLYGGSLEEYITLTLNYESADLAAVPEPSTLAGGLLGVALMGGVWLRRRRQAA